MNIDHFIGKINSLIINKVYRRRINALFMFFKYFSDERTYLYKIPSNFSKFIFVYFPITVDVRVMSLR